MNSGVTHVKKGVQAMVNFASRWFSGQGRRPVLATAAGAAALAVTVGGGGVAIAAVTSGSAPASTVASHESPGNPKPQPQVNVTGPTVTIPPGGFLSASVTCPVNTEIMGGGEVNSSAAGQVVLTDSFPATNTSWRAFVRNTSTTTTFTFNAVAVCR